MISNQPSIVQFMIDHGAQSGRQESAGLDSTDDDQGHLHGELEEGISGRGADAKESDGAQGLLADGGGTK